MELFGKITFHKYWSNLWQFATIIRSPNKAGEYNLDKVFHHIRAHAPVKTRKLSNQEAECL